MFGSYTRYLINHMAALKAAEHRRSMMERGEMGVECPYCHFPKVREVSTGRIAKEDGVFIRTNYTCSNTACFYRFWIDIREEIYANDNK